MIERSNRSAARHSASALCCSSCCRSSAAVTVCLSRSAHTSAVIPLPSRCEASALASSSASKTAAWPLKAANIRAEMPKLSCRLTLTPRLSSIVMISYCPPTAAAVSSVHPACSAHRASRRAFLPHPSSHATTRAVFPYAAASHTATGSPTSIGCPSDVASLNSLASGLSSLMWLPWC